MSVCQEPLLVKNCLHGHLHIATLRSPNTRRQFTSCLEATRYVYCGIPQQPDVPIRLLLMHTNHNKVYAIVVQMVMVFKQIKTFEFNERSCVVC